MGRPSTSYRGALCPENCFWYFVHFSFQGSWWKYKPADSKDDTLKVLGTPICRLQPEEAEQTLGVWIAMDRNWKKQISELHGKSREFASNLKRQKVIPRDSWYSFVHSFLPLLEYGLPVFSISEKNWDYILQPALLLVLPWAGIVSIFPRNLLFTSTRFQGLGVKHPFFKQHLLQIEVLMGLIPSLNLETLVIGMRDEV